MYYSRSGSSRANQPDISYDWGAPQIQNGTGRHTTNSATQHLDRGGHPNSGKPSFAGASLNDVRGLRDAGREFLSTRVLSPLSEKINAQAASSVRPTNSELSDTPIIHSASSKPHRNLRTTETRGFFSTLFDLSFSSFITLKFAKFLYVFNMVLLGVVFIVGLVLF